MQTYFISTMLYHEKKQREWDNKENKSITKETEQANFTPELVFK